MSSPSKPKRLIDRKVRATISSGSYTLGGLQLIVNDSLDNPSENDFRITFNGTRTATPTADTCSVDIYNLNSLSREILTTIFANDPKMLLECGYKDVGFDTVFKGDVRIGSHSKNSADWMTNIQGGDGANVVGSINLDKSYKGPVPVDTVMADIIKLFLDKEITLTERARKIVPLITQEIKLTIGSMKNSPAYHGNAMDILNRILSKAGSTAIVRDGQLDVIKFSADNIPNMEIIRLGVGSGLLSGPFPNEQGGSTIRCQLRGDVRPGECIEVDTLLYGITSVQYSGDNKGAQWEATCETIRMDNLIPGKLLYEMPFIAVA